MSTACCCCAVSESRIAFWALSSERMWFLVCEVWAASVRDALLGALLLLLHVAELGGGGEEGLGLEGPGVGHLQDDRRLRQHLPRAGRGEQAGQRRLGRVLVVRVGDLHDLLLGRLVGGLFACQLLVHGGEPGLGRGQLLLGVVVLLVRLVELRGEAVDLRLHLVNGRLRQRAGRLRDRRGEPDRRQHGDADQGSTPARTRQTGSQSRAERHLHAPSPCPRTRSNPGQAIESARGRRAACGNCDHRVIDHGISGQNGAEYGAARGAPERECRWAALPW